MTTVFDGMAGVLNDMFGAPVIHTPAGGAARTIQGVFRREPITVTDDEGFEVLVMAPTLRVLAADAALMQRGDSVAIGAEAYLVVNGQPSGSPAGDAFTVFELEKEG